MQEPTPRRSIFELLVEPLSIKVSSSTKWLWILFIAGFLSGGSPVVPLRVFAGKHPFQEFQDAKVPWSGLQEDVNDYTVQTFDQMIRNIQFRASLGMIIHLAFLITLTIFLLKERKGSHLVAAALWIALFAFGVVTRNEPLHL